MFCTARLVVFLLSFVFAAAARTLTSMAPKRFVYSEEEKDVLTSLVHKYSHILENKKTDAVSLNLKTQLWETLSTEYNSINGIRPRDVKQLKKLWDNLKVKWKSAKAEETRTTFGTGKDLNYFTLPSI